MSQMQQLMYAHSSDESSVPIYNNQGIHDLYKIITESASQGIWVLDSNASTLYCNPCMLEMLGYSESELENRTLYEFCFPEDLAFAGEKIAQTLTGESQKFDCRLRSRGGALLWTLACTSPLKDTNGTSVGVVGFFSDITNRRIAEIAVRESEKRFRAMADTAPVMMWITGADTECTYLNKHWLEFTGRSYAQELGTGWTESVHQEDVQYAVQTYQSAFEKRMPFEMEFRLRRHDGVYRWILDRGTPRFTTEGQFMGYIGSCLDISDRKEHEETLQQLANIIETSEDAIFSTDLRGRVQTWNKGAEAVYGYTADEIISKNLIATIVPKDKKNELQALYIQVRNDNQVASFETINRKKSGELFDALVTISRIKNDRGKVVGASVIAQDISEKKRTEWERDELLMQLNQLISIAPIGIAFINNKLQYVKVNEMLATINNLSREEIIYRTPTQVLSPSLAKIVTRHLRTVLRTKQSVTFEYRVEASNPDRSHRWWMSTYYPIQLGKSEYGVGALVQDITEQKLIDRRKDDFISMASHELKTPVTTIKAFTQILQNIENIPADNARKYLQKMSEEINRLTKLINDFLDISKIRTGRLRIITEEFNFSDLVTETVTAYQDLYPKQQFDLQKTSVVIVEADRTRIAQVLSNLLDNAIKYSPNKSPIRLKVAHTQSTVEFSIADQGVGISEENQKLIFQSFYREYGTESQEFPGLGIGLYIASEVIKAHRGTIAVESKKGKGSVFYVSLPITQRS